MEKISTIAQFDAPYGKLITFKQVSYDNGFKILRLRIKEGQRFTDIDLDTGTLKQCHQLFSNWLAQQQD